MTEESDSEDDNIYTITTSAIWSNNPEETKTTKSKDALSVFSEGECGEPLPAQHLQLNFTLDEEDNEYQQEKCCDFWSFIHSLPQIQHMMVKPEKHYADISKTTVTSMESFQPAVEDNAADIGRTAVSMLEHVQEKGFINRTFEAKMPQSSCSLGSREYKELQDPTKKTKSVPCSSSPTDKSMKVPSISTKRPSSLKTMVKKMEDWDAEHPKSMDPPGHPPSLQHCILQRPYY